MATENTEFNSNSSGSGRYDTFLDNFNKGNKYLNDLTGAFFQQINVDKNILIKKDDEPLKNRFVQINDVENDNTKTFYQKTLATGNILLPVAGEIVHAQDPEVKKSGINILNSFFNIAKASGDQQLIDIAVRISENIKI